MSVERTLHHFPLDPASRQVRLALGEKWLAFDEMGTPYAYNPGTSVLTPMNAGTISLKCKEMVLNIIIEPFTGELRLGPVTPTP